MFKIKGSSCFCNWSIEEGESLVEVAIFGIQIEEVIEEDRDRNVVLDDELGVDLGGMSDVLCLSCFVKDMVWRKMRC